MIAYKAYPNIPQEKALIAFLEALDIPFEKVEEVLPQHVLDGIKRGQEDVEAGRFISREEFKKKYNIK